MARELTPGDPAPALVLTAHDGSTVDLTQHRERAAVVYFYPRAFTPGCTTETVEFQAASRTLADAGISVVGISPDPPEKLARFRDKHGITFPLLSDPDKTALAAWGAFGEKKNYGRTVMGVIRSTFVVDADGTPSLARYNVRAKGHVAMICGLLGIEIPVVEG